jgi:hypothetical protein
MITTRAEQKNARRRFVAIYALSLILVFVVVSAFWQKLANKKDQDSAPVSSEKEAYFMQLDTVLHARMNNLDSVCATYVKARQTGANPDATALLELKNSVRTSLDSLDQQAGYLNEGPKKAMMTLVMASFRKEFADRETVINGISTLPRQAFNSNTATTGSDAAGSSLTIDSLKRSLQAKDETIAGLQKQVQLSASDNNNAANDGLQKTVADKDKIISSLQAQLKQKEAALQNLPAQSKPAAGGEWQQKYQSLKSSFDKVAASEKSLKNAYQTLADDNRRLLSQLQAARKG